VFRKLVTVLSNHSALRKKSKSLPDYGSWTAQDKKDLGDLFETFNVLQGYGLAAPQIGILKRAIVVNLRALGVSSEENAVMINPIMETWGSDQRNEEACFSVPYVSAKVTRPSHCKVSYITLEGEAAELEFVGFPAACIQHEIDHLDGKLYIDRVGAVYRGMLLKKVKKAHDKIIREERKAKEEFDREHQEFYGTKSNKEKTTHTRKRKPKARKKRPRRSKKK